MKIKGAKNGYAVGGNVLQEGGIKKRGPIHRSENDWNQRSTPGAETGRKGRRVRKKNREEKKARREKPYKKEGQGRPLHARGARRKTKEKRKDVTMPRTCSRSQLRRPKEG